ncbi:hypothetical protein ACHAXS_002965 [Conticribra weissflogii]
MIVTTRLAAAQIIVDNATSTCHLPLATLPAQSTTSSAGILFAIRSSPSDPVGPTITSFGFHVDPNGFDVGSSTSSSSTALLGYEVYGLNYPGHYADPLRQEFQLDPLSYDYRGDFVHWTLLSSGNLSPADLLDDPTTVTVVRPDYFRIPFERFSREEEAARVPPEGGTRSFYLTLVPTLAAFQYRELDEGMALNDAVPVLVDDDGDDDATTTMAPSILVGEGVVEYPFPDTPFLYAPKVFVGKVFYERTCPSLSPSASAAPSGGPTATGSEGPSGSPSASVRPSDVPSGVMSEEPSGEPSGGPTALAVEVSSGLLLALNLDLESEEGDCGENEVEVELSQEETTAVTEAVTVTAGPEAEETMVVNLRAEVTGVVLTCADENASGNGTRTRTRTRKSRTLESLIRNAIENMTMAADAHSIRDTRRRRRLPTASSSLDFSVVITGEYRPLSRPGDAAVTPSQPLPDLGAVAEQSINRNTDTFLAELQSRTPPDSGFLTAVTGVTAAKLDGDDSPPLGQGFARYPTRSPTEVPTTITTTTTKTSAEVTDRKDTILLIGIIVSSGIMVLLASLLFFRHAERKAVENRRKRMEKKRYEERMMEMEMEMEKRNRVWEERNGRHPNHFGYPPHGDNGTGPPIPNPYGVPPTTRFPPPPQGNHSDYDDIAYSSSAPPDVAGWQGHPPGSLALAQPPVDISRRPSQRQQEWSWQPQHHQQQPEQSQQQSSESIPQNYDGYSGYAQGPSEYRGSQQRAPHSYSHS